MHALTGESVKTGNTVDTVNLKTWCGTWVTENEARQALMRITCQPLTAVKIAECEGCKNVRV